MMISNKLLFLLLPAAILFSACLDSTSPEFEDYDNTPDLEFLEENAQSEDVTVTESGLQYRIIEEGDGLSPSDESIAIIHVLSTRVDGSVLTDTYEQDQPAVLPVNNLLPGLSEGLKLMNRGATYEFVLPSELTLNNFGQPPQGVPQGAALIFEIELLESDPEFLQTNAQREDVEVSESGLQYRVIEEGTGSTPGPDSEVRVNYTGKLIYGAIFDQTAENTPAEFTIDGVIEGFGEGLQLMSEGSTYEFFIPGELAYGDQPPQQSGIYPGATLVFEVELVSIGDE